MKLSEVTADQWVLVRLMRELVREVTDDAVLINNPEIVRIFEYLFTTIDPSTVNTMIDLLMKEEKAQSHD